MRSNICVHASLLGVSLASSLTPLTAAADFVQGDYTYTVTNDTATITLFNKEYVGDLAITDTLGGFPVTGIGDWTFSECTGLTRVVMPDSVTEIGEWAFAECAGLTNVVISEGVTRIKDGTFHGCCSLPCVTIPPGVTSIGNYAFWVCTGLADVMLPASVTNIGDGAFAECSSLTSAVIPASVTGIGSGAFSTCGSLSRVLFKGNAPNSALPAFSDSPVTVYYLLGAADWGGSFGGRPTALWDPQIRSAAGFGFVDARFGFTIDGAAYLPIVVEACANLAVGPWTPIEVNTLGADGSFRFIDPDSPANAVRFYRVVWP